MSAVPAVPKPRYGPLRLPSGLDTIARSRALLAGLLAEPSGQVSASVYETARLVTLAPWLAGHVQRIAFVLGARHPDGHWGGPGGYGLVPTLSATEALLKTLRAASAPGVDRAAVLTGARSGLHALFGWLGRPGPLALADLPAVELIVPALVGAINTHLDELVGDPVVGLDSFRGAGRLHLPTGMDHEPVHAIRARLRAGDPLPLKLLHALEVAGADARGARGVRPTTSGSVGASPAATAAWLGAGLSGPGGGRPPHGDQGGTLSIHAAAIDAASIHAARSYLEQLVARTGGPVPCAAPITTFEQAWVVAALSRGGLSLAAVPLALVRSLDSALGDAGAAGGSGLPADADSTSVTLFALAQLGMRRPLSSLRSFELATHFCTWPGEQGKSTSVNAHVLEALDGSPDRAPAHKAMAWLLERQRGEGIWTDRWHASAYYPTACCVLALNRAVADSPAGDGPATASVRAATAKAATWLIQTQNADGSWGDATSHAHAGPTWSDQSPSNDAASDRPPADHAWTDRPSTGLGTLEETAYAVQTLLAAEETRGGAGDRALARGYAALRASIDVAYHPPLWHDKDLYAPHAIVRAEALAAVHRAQSDTRVARPATAVGVR